MNECFLAHWNGSGWCLLLRFEASLVAQMVKNPPVMQETRVQSLGREDSLEKEMATHSSGLENPHGQRSLAGYSPQGGKELDTTERLTLAYLLI